MSAVISECGLYRYRLDRTVRIEGPVAAFFGVNPSTATAFVSDATIRKEIGFSAVHGWRRLIKGNVFAFRATDVGELATAVDPMGPENQRYIREIAAEADIIIPCWGRRSKIPKHMRHHLDETLELLLSAGKPVMTFGYTKCGEPLHPLMLPYSTVLQPIN
jgi:hypothetical protein